MSAAPATQSATVARVTGPNSFLTTSGHEIRLASITTPRSFTLPAATGADAQAKADEPDETIADDPPVPDATSATTPDDPIAAARSSLDALLTGQEVKLSPVTPAPDRYGRIRARVARSSDGLWIEAELVAKGLARVQPQTDDFGCARHLEMAEGAARTAGLGLWALPEFAVLDGSDTSRDRWIGRYVLIEGKVVSLGKSGTRRYLNFGKNFSRDFAVVLVDKGTSKAQATKLNATPNRFLEEGFEADTVVGKRIRVRGILLKGSGGGLIMPLIPEEIEWIVDAP